MTKKEQLNDLFKKWQARSSESIKQDGINNESLFAKAVTKVLFIMKEPNDPAKTANDFRKWWETGIKYQFSIRLSEWSYGILNDFPEFNTFHRNRTKKHHAIQQIAFMNVKKVGGTSKAKPPIILKYTKDYCDLIQKEIDIIRPELIILGLSFWKQISNEIFPKIIWKNSGCGIDIAKYNNAKIIDFYHPSATNKTSKDFYCLLGDTMHSKAFQSLK